MKEKKCCELKAVYTVEAAFLLPMILTIIFMVIYIAYYYHDKALLQAAAYQAALRGSQLYGESNAAMELEAGMAARELIRGRLLIADNISIQASANMTEVTVSYKGSFQIPKAVMPYKLLRNAGSEISISESVKCMDAVSFIRKFRWGKELLQK